MKKILYTLLAILSLHQMTTSSDSTSLPAPVQITGTTNSVSIPSTGQIVIPIVTEASFTDMINNIKEDTNPTEALLAFFICLSKTTTEAQTSAVTFYNNLTPAQQKNQLGDISSADELKNTIAPTYWGIYQQFSDDEKQLFYTAIIETASNWSPPKAILSGVGTPISTASANQN